MLFTLIYGIAILSSSLLLFLVQPVMAKAILPWLGGSAGVWTTAMVFFQVALLLGYLYAHLLTRYLSGWRQFWVHVSLLALSLRCLPLRADASYPGPDTAPALRVLAVLALSVGFPYFMLSSTGPLLQRWYARGGTGIPYRLFAVSNIGSLAALVLYPFLIEPRATVRQQMDAWSMGYAAVTLMLALAALRAVRGRAAAAPVEELVTTDPIPLSDRLRWIALAACPSALWLGVAAELSQNVAPIPLLWILPLSVYLLSFILTFDSEGWYRPRAYRFLLPLCWAVLAFDASRLGNVIPITATVGLITAVLFVSCMFCHGELAARKPDPSHLTGYYLMLSAGGALGGLFVGLAAPLLFDRYLELPIAIAGCILLGLWLVYRLPRRRLIRLAVLSVAAMVVAMQAGNRAAHDRLRVRNFYGALRVSDACEGESALRTIYNGPINHGSQYLAAGRARVASTYYGAESGAGLVFRLAHGQGRRVGIVGLGAGTLAAYGERGDTFRFYELNPAVTTLARTEFHYLGDCPCETTVVPGDGRLALEREAPNNFDLLTVDAFNGDSIPVHLLTRQAFDAYLKHLRPGGILALHVTNRYLDLTPVANALTAERGLHPLLIQGSPDAAANVYPSTWIVASSDARTLEPLASKASPFPPASRLRPWTDDYSSLFQVLR